MLLIRRSARPSSLRSLLVAALSTYIIAYLLWSLFTTERYECIVRGRQEFRKLIDRHFQSRQPIPSPSQYFLRQKLDEYRTHYNRPAPDGFSDWLAFAQHHQCSLDPATYSRIDRDLEPFRQRRRECVQSGRCASNFMQTEIITKQMLATAQRLTKVGWVRVIAADGQMEISDSNSWALKSFRQTLIDYGIASKLPVGLFVVINLIDEPRVLRQPPDDSSAATFTTSTTSTTNKFQYNPQTGEYKTKLPGTSVMPLMQQVCNISVSQLKKHGFFLGPMSFAVTEQLLPVFSSSSLGQCFADIIYPSHYYMDSLDGYTSLEWSEKREELYWRGSSTGGYATASPDNQYHEFHRHRLISTLQPRLFKQTAGIDMNPRIGERLHGVGVPINVQFSSVGQCRPDICSTVAKEYGPLSSHESFSEAKRYKYLLDIDGNSFSQRFLPFLRTTSSLVLRVAMFEDWLTEQVRPGEHYLNVDMDLHDLPDRLRWARDNDEEARRIAERAKEFAAKRLRKDDMVCYLYRLLLEYHHLTLP